MVSRQRTFRSAVKWSFVMSWGGQGFAALVVFALAALLGPEAFGTVAMAAAYVALIEMFLEQGLVAAIIQRRDLRDEHLDSVFWLNLALGAALTGVSVLLSDWWARVNELPDLAPVIQVLSLTIPLRSLTLVQQAVLQREMDFKSLSVRANISVLIGGVAGVAMALTGWGVWALVGQKLAEAASSMLLLWSVGRWRPGWRFSWTHLREILGFSAAVFVGSIGGYLSSRADALLIGLFFGHLTVGLYRLAQRVMDLVVTLTTRSLTFVALPHFSAGADDREAMRRKVKTFIKLSATLAFPALACTAACARHLTAVLGPEWSAATPALQLLCLVGAVSALTLFTRPLMNAMGRPRLASINIWIFGLAAVGALALTGWLYGDAPEPRQVVAVAVARVAVALLLTAPLSLGWAMHISGLRFGEFLASIAAPTLSAAAALAVSAPFYLWRPLQHLHPVIGLGIIASLTGGTAAAVLLAMDAQARAAAVSAFQWVLQRPPSLADKG